MNKELKNILNKYGDTSALNLESLNEVSVNLQGSQSKDIIFYGINNEKSWPAFYQRYESGNPGLLIINEVPEKLSSKDYLIVEKANFEKLQNELCDLFYPKDLIPKLIGITGTNGKSTVVHLCSEILRHNGLKSFSVGTVGIFSGDKQLLKAPEATTPSYVDLRRILFKLREYDVGCLEISSHGLEQNRLRDLLLDSIAWTNITQDHLDFHKTMEAYFDAKLLITKCSNNNLLIPYGEEELRTRLDEKNISYETCPKPELSKLSLAFNLDYNMKNLSIALCLCSKYITGKIKLDFDLQPPKGRYNTFDYKKSVYVVDYAHTPDALRNVLEETKRSFPSYKIVTLFGCGGDRDRGKRVKMLEAVLDISDRVIVTSDNPRTEDPKQILRDIVKGYEEHGKIQVIESRAKAIEENVIDYPKKTIVIIAGKGHEEYQEINGVKHHFSDIEEVLKRIEVMSETI